MEQLIEATATNARAAAERIAKHVRKTPLVRSSTFSDELEADVWFKLENQQETGSFKLRGATNRLLTLGDEDRERGCVTASSGNHGAATACALQKLGASGTIYVPEQTSPAKVAKIRGYGGNIEFFGTDGLDTEQHARSQAEASGRTYVSPYNDPEVIAGQGTCGVEIADQLADVDVVFVAVGGGGLIGGVGAVLKSHNPKIRIVGCQPEASAVMARSVAAGELLDLPSKPTLSDGTAGGIEPDAITFPLAEAVVDEWIEVAEDEITNAMRHYMDSEGHVIEGAAGVAVAAMLLQKQELRGKKVVTVICGGNISDAVLSEVQV